MAVWFCRFLGGSCDELQCMTGRLRFWYSVLHTLDIVGKTLFNTVSDVELASAA